MSADEDSFSLVVVEFKFVVCHPVFYIRVTVRCACQKILYTVR